MQMIIIQTPRPLTAAVEALETLTADEVELHNALADALGNATAANFEAISEAVSRCRAALDSIEAEAFKRLISERDAARAILASLEAMDVMKAA
jgi:hypothetical protein